MGFPSPAADYAEDRISLDKEIIQHPNATFFATMEGDSMVNAFIPPGALLVIDRSSRREIWISFLPLSGENLPSGT